MLNTKQIRSYVKPIGKYIHRGALFQLCLDLNSVWGLASYSNKQIRTELKFLCKNWKAILKYNRLDEDNVLYQGKWRKVIRHFIGYFGKELPITEEQFNIFLDKHPTRFAK
jgi:hypothetical protein